MLITILSIFALPGAGKHVSAQQYYTKNGHISFYSKAPIENITATNDQVLCILNTKNGLLQFSLLVKNFHFKKSLMEEHFNENYMESDQYPRASFKGNILNIEKLDFTKDKKYTVTVSGNLTIHGITKNVTTSGNLSIVSGKIILGSTFSINLSDFKINIPKLVQSNISETPEITVLCQLDHKI